jgi:polyhydroxybutyrate depolymerase
MMLGPGDHQLEVLSEGAGRTYLVHAPRQYDTVARLPAMVVLHGGGGSATFAQRVHGWPDLSEREGCLVVFPEASLEDPARCAAVRENPRIWNDGSRRSAVARRNVDDIGYLASVLDDLQTNFAVDPDRIFVTGFSNGASMAFRVGIELADRIAAIAPVSGHLCLVEPRPARPLSMLYVVGLSDPINPMAGGPVESPWGSRRQKPPIIDSIHAWVRLIGASLQPDLVYDTGGVKLVRYGPGETGCEVQLCTIEGQGHEWPGARRTLPRSISGPQTDKINATQVVWDFFASTSIPQ